MFDFHEKRKIRGWLYSKITIGALLAVAILISFNVVERFKVEREMAEKRTEQEDALLELKQRAATLEAKVEHLKNNRGVEEELRSRFDVAKEGEQVVVIVGEEETAPDLDALKSPPGEDGNARSFWDLFKFW